MKFLIGLYTYNKNLTLYFNFKFYRYKKKAAYLGSILEFTILILIANFSEIKSEIILITPLNNKSDKILHLCIIYLEFEFKM